MIGKYRAISLFITLITCLSIVFSMAGCGDDDDDILGLDPAPQFQLTSDKGPEHYVYPGEVPWLYVICTPEMYRPEKPVYVWRISFNQNQIEEIVHDSEPEVEKPEASRNSLYSWPNSDDLFYKCTNEGIYKFQVDLYDYNEYTSDENTAKIYSSYTHTVYCEHFRISIEATPTENSRVYNLKATVANPQYITSNYPSKWQFINESTGLVDTGMTEEISFPYDLSNKGTHEVEHRFQQAGKYKVVFTIESHTGEQIASAQTTVDVTHTFQILAPEGPLKTGQEYTFTARTDSPEVLPDSPVYKWDFGDGNGITIPFSNEAIHLYVKGDTYTVSVQLFESEEAGAPLLGTATAEVEVEASADHLTEIQQMNKFALDFAIQHDYVEGMSGIFLWDWDSHGEVVWNGVNGFMEWEQYGHSERMTCRVSEDGTVLEQLKIRHEFAELDAWYELEIQNLPFWEGAMPDRFAVNVDDEDVENYVVYFHTYRTAGYHWNTDARLYVRFEK